MGIGKSISLFLVDGSVDGVIACELLNWTGKGYKIPRNLLKTVGARDDLKKAGVYFLIGYDETDHPTVYIGEAEEVYKRLTQHQDKEFWTEAAAFVSKDENLNKAHVKYLEYALFKAAQEAGRYKVSNENTPTKPAISEAEQAVMREFGENLITMVGTLGYKIFERLTKHRAARQDIYVIEAARGAKAQGIQTNEGFVVLKGSRIADSEVASTPGPVKAKRAALLADGSVQNNVVMKEILFSSPSLAAAVVMGRSANGQIEWELPNGSTFKDNQAPTGKEI